MAKQTKAKKLSKAQQGVLAMMADGWELGSSSTFTGGSWLQKGGLGRGGESRVVSSATVTALVRAGAIKQHYGFPTSRYTITPKDPRHED